MRAELPTVSYEGGGSDKGVRSRSWARCSMPTSIGNPMTTAFQFTQPCSPVTAMRRQARENLLEHGLA